MTPSTSATLNDCRQFVEAIQKAQGRVPDALNNIIDGADLLADQHAPSDPATTIVKSAAAGELSLYKLTNLVNEAALQQMRATYLGDLKRRIERLFVSAFHQALADGGADAVLDSLRESFDTAANAITEARDLIPIETPAEAFLHSAQPGAIAAWQGLDTQLKTIASIAAVASQFGCRIARFPLIEEYANADGFRLNDLAITCTDGPNLAVDSQLFSRPDRGHRDSPFFKLPLKLHTVDSMRARYNVWAAAEWERNHSGPGTRWMDTAGNLREMEKPTNPYQPKVDA